MVRALVYREGRGIAVEDVPPPSVPGEVLVNVLLAGICGTDTHAVQKGFPPLGSPVILGHEFVGVRQDTGEIVVANPNIWCGECAWCLSGDSHHCVSRGLVGSPSGQHGGAFAEQVSVPPDNLVPVGSTTSTVQAALTEPVAVALHAWRRVSPAGGAKVGIIGAGAIGMSVLHVAAAYGAAAIDMTDINPYRLEQAVAAGATNARSELGSGYDVVFDTVGTAATRAAAVAALRHLGTCVLLGIDDMDIVLKAPALMVSERTIVGSFSYRHSEFREAVDLVEAIPTDWAATVPLGQGAAILHGRQAPPRGAAKVLLDPTK